MAGFFYDMTHPANGNLSSFNVTINEEQQCVLTVLDKDGKPCDFTIHNDLEDLADRIAEEAAGDDGYARAIAWKADGKLCDWILDVGTWQEAADTLNGPDGKDKWVMFGKWLALGPWAYLDRNDGKTFVVTDLGKKLDAMHKSDKAVV